MISIYHVLYSQLNCLSQNGFLLNVRQKVNFLLSLSDIFVNLNLASKSWKLFNFYLYNCLSNHWNVLFRGMGRRELKLLTINLCKFVCFWLTWYKVTIIGKFIFPLRRWIGGIIMIIYLVILIRNVLKGLYVMSYCRVYVCAVSVHIHHNCCNICMLRVCLCCTFK